MVDPTMHSDAPIRRPAPARGSWIPCLLVAALAGCVTEDPKTGTLLPRDGQKLTFDVVQRNAEKLHTGMSKLDVHLLLGSPAEKDEAEDLWIYLPERYAVLVPARALRLEFRDRVLVDFGYRPIVLGTRL